MAESRNNHCYRNSMCKYTYIIPSESYPLEILLILFTAEHLHTYCYIYIFIFFKYRVPLHV